MDKVLELKVIVLGAGLVGNVIARDLAEDIDTDVSLVDVNQDTLDKITANYNIHGICADLSNPNVIKEIIVEYDIVVGALPGFMGFQAVKAVIEAGKNIVDISFFEEDPFELDELAKEKGVTAVIDAGVAPGLSSIILGHVDSVLDETEDFLCYVGGLPIIRDWPFEYKAPFSPSDVLEEYTRLARYVENSEIVVKQALSEPELLEFDGVGTLEAFNTDGLRSLLRTMNIPFMKEKTLRYPGHIEKMRMLRETGFFDKKTVKLNGKEIRPIDLTSKLLFDKWKMEEGDEDLTVMKITVEGRKEEKKLRYSYYMLDKYDTEKKVISMARTTGYTCTAIVKQIIEGVYDEKGIIPPAYLGKHLETYTSIIEELAKRNVIIKEEIQGI
ncbi:MAG: saccharopine dehydrogenase NADP-binding domain-containing protein [Candidatus Heimdallarchaeota archaeon]|nr:saccharopine dehydrogenase NADP-binding domain-containing protein [Candidatus Heimdallarchaeota archaeon]